MIKCPKLMNYAYFYIQPLSVTEYYEVRHDLDEMGLRSMHDVSFPNNGIVVSVQDNAYTHIINTNLVYKNVFRYEQWKKIINKPMKNEFPKQVICIKVPINHNAIIVGNEYKAINKNSDNQYWIETLGFYATAYFKDKETREIIGYKPPYHLYDGIIDKNSVLKIDGHKLKKAYYYNGYSLPIEWIENPNNGWIPVYKEEEDYLELAPNDHPIRIYKNKLMFRDCSGNWLELDNLGILLMRLRSMNTEYQFHTQTIEIMGKIFTRAQCRAFLIKYDEFQNS